MNTTLRADAGTLVASKHSPEISLHPSVHPDDPRIQVSDDALAAGQAVRPHHRGKSVRSDIRHSHGLLLRAKRYEARHRTEDLLQVNPTVDGETLHDRRRHEHAVLAPSRDSHSLTPAQNSTTLLAGQIYVTHNLPHVIPGYDGSDVGPGHLRVSHHQLPHAGHQTVAERGVDVLVHEKTRRAEADLALVGKGGPDGGSHREVEVRVRKDERRILAAHLQRHLLEEGRRQSGNHPPRRRTAREADRAHLGVLHQALAHLRPRSVEDVEHSRRYPRLRAQLAQQVGGVGCDLRRLGNHAVPRRQRRRHLPRKQVKGKVPRGDTHHHPQRIAHGHVQHGRMR
mmetsp:Transcript_2022/g.5620  ORF Transcript_2022/g.5620 Transcript_2022/m.5620 type:complete len:340 (-) Transcript_2022:488-1507(-)